MKILRKFHSHQLAMAVKQIKTKQERKNRKKKLPNEIRPVETGEEKLLQQHYGKCSKSLIERTAACSSVPRPKLATKTELRGMDRIQRQCPNGRTAGQLCHQYRAVTIETQSYCMLRCRIYMTIHSHSMRYVHQSSFRMLLRFKFEIGNVNVWESPCLNRKPEWWKRPALDDREECETKASY